MGGCRGTHTHSSQDSMEEQSRLPSALVPIRVEFETDTHRIRDCFVWNLHEKLVTPESFARTFCTDLDIPHVPWVETVATQIRAQLEEMEGVGGMDLAVDVLADMDADGEETYRGDEVPECRVVLAVRALLLFSLIALILKYLPASHDHDEAD